MLAERFFFIVGMPEKSRPCVFFVCAVERRKSWLFTICQKIKVNADVDFAFSQLCEVGHVMRAVLLRMLY